MVLIIPETQTPVSLVEQPRIPQGMATGAEGVSALGNLGVNLQARKVKVEQDRTLRAARLAAMDQLDQLRHTYENDTNLDGLSTRWQADAARVTEAITKGLPAHLQKDFSLSMGEVIMPQTSALRGREDALFKDRETAALNADLRGFERAAANAPTEEARQAIYDQAADAIGAAVDGAYLSATEAEKIMAELPKGAETLVAQRLLEEDPEALLEWIETDQGILIDPKDALTLSRAARANIAATETQRMREREMLAKAAERELTTETNEAVSILRAGLPYKGMTDLLTKADGTPQGDRLVAEIEAAELNAAFAAMTPAEQDAELARLRLTPTDKKATADNLTRLEGMATQTRASLEKDPLAHVASRGILPIEPVDISDPKSVAVRRAKAETVFREFTPDAAQIRYLDTAEANRLSAVLSGPDTDQALGVLTSIAENWGDAAPSVMTQIGASDPVALLAGALVAETGDITAPRAILRGRAMLKEGKGAKAAAEVRRAVPSEFAAAFPTQGDPRLETLLAGADAHYAATGLMVTDPKSAEARAAYAASFQANAGQTRRGEVVYGGFQPVHGQTTLLPPGMTARQAEMALTSFPDSAWKRGSLSGNLPRGFENYTADHREDWTLLSLRDGSYALGYRQRSGSIVYLQDPAHADGLFRLDLNSFVTGRSN